MEIELTTFNFDVKLNILFKSKLNPIKYSERHNDFYYYNLYYYFYWLYIFINITKTRTENIINIFQEINNIPVKEDLFFSIWDNGTYYSFINAASNFNIYKSFIYDNKIIYSKLFTVLLYERYYI